jgi:hypothetical protein
MKLAFAAGDGVQLVTGAFGEEVHRESVSVSKIQVFDGQLLDNIDGRRLSPRGLCTQKTLSPL